MCLQQGQAIMCVSSGQRMEFYMWIGSNVKNRAISALNHISRIGFGLWFCIHIYFQFSNHQGDNRSETLLLEPPWVKCWNARICLSLAKEDQKRREKVNDRTDPMPCSSYFSQHSNYNGTVLFSVWRSIVHLASIKCNHCFSYHIKLYPFATQKKPLELKMMHNCVLIMAHIK